MKVLIEPEELADHLNDPEWVIVDCRSSFADSASGRSRYEAAHIPGAVYAHLEEDLSSPIIEGKTGRHPLPSVEAAASSFSRLGISSSKTVVAYDDAGAGLAASRLWWLLMWLGHDQAYVLDGGWVRWQREKLPTSSGVEHRSPEMFIPHEHPEMVASTAEVDALRQKPGTRIIDVRAPERYRGEKEPLDSVAGRVPGALSAPYLENLDETGNFLPPDVLRARYQALFGGRPVEDAIFYCGSGVTAAQGILAVAHANLGLPRLYAGSWSEWITNPERPVERG